ncbi:methyl-accepting chemotaxis protein [Sulfuritalea sp.]|uniref:methyl-accepting chemotaxis protein n=1 Tax=Sulfuritalea sp. TaxID=2480090 RepID=UPI00286D80DE|nr:methyl-accepting chemotaxis protein [Sulfuritalea sp.]
MLIFGPAKAIMDRLPYKQKFALMGGLSAIAIALLLVHLLTMTNATIGQATNELTGLKLLKPALEAKQLIEQHRALTTLALASKESADASAKKAVAIEAEVAGKLTNLEVLVAGDASKLKLDKALEHVKSSWTAVAGPNWKDKPPTLNLNTHGTALAAINQLIRDAADESQLVADSSLDTLYIVSASVLQLPVMLDQLSRIRDVGVEILLRGKPNEGERAQFSKWMGAAEETRNSVLISLKRAAQNNPNIIQELKVVEANVDKNVGIITAMAEGNLLAEPYLSGDALSESGQEATSGLFAELTKTMLPLAERLIEKRLASLRIGIYISMSVVAVAVLLFIYLSVGAYLAVMGGVRSLSATVLRIGEGDLSGSANLESRDELAAVAVSVNKMISQMRELIHGIKDTADRVKQSAQALLASSQHLATATGEQNDATASMAATMEETTTSIAEISRGTREALAVSADSGKLSVRGGEVISQTVVEIEAISGAVTSSAQAVDELGQLSSRITGIVQVIREIADQTNLLALNAAIEAARAGDSGRGFAVVADEVRKLAERTANSTQEIATMVSAIQSGTQGAVERMESGVKRVQHGVELTREAGLTMARIQEGATRVAQRINEISLAMNEQDSASQEIARNVELIAQRAGENSMVVKEATATAGQLDNLAGQLSAMVSRFRLS